MKHFFVLLLVVLLTTGLIACKTEEKKTNSSGDETVVTQQFTESELISQDFTGPNEAEANNIMREYNKLSSLQLCKQASNIHPGIPTSYPDIVLGHRDNPTLGLALNLNSSEAEFSGVDPNTQYTNMLNENCYFDVYFESVNSVRKDEDYCKVSLKVHIAYVYSNHNSYQCMFYESLYPHMEIGGQYKLFIVAREGDTILGWTEDWFEWGTETDQVVKDIATSEQYAK